MSRCIHSRHATRPSLPPNRPCARRPERLQHGVSSQRRILADPTARDSRCGHPGGWHRYERGPRVSRDPVRGTPARWDGVRSADQLGHNCMQARPYDDIDPYAAGISEDCLYLNVWTKSLDGRRPVMVWIHGGGFFAGFGGEDRHDGARLAQKGAVVVTINYRLGAFGFLAHPALTAESPVHASGNYGLLDQIAALQWVQRNAARFGGDPSRVTIFGESAGGMSVGDLVASPLARGSFTGAILESGTGSGPFVQRLDTTEAIGMRVAAALGVTGRDANALARLRAVSADTLLATAIRVAGGADRVLHWPTLDGYVLPRSV